MLDLLKMNINSIFIHNLLIKTQGLSFQGVSEEWLNFKIQNSFEDKPRCGVIALAQKCLTQDVYPHLDNVEFSHVKRYDLVLIMALLHKDLKIKVILFYSNLSDNLGMRSA